MSRRIVIVSGYFDPPHVGHLDLFARAKALAGGGIVLAIVNNDAQARLKYGRYPMMNEHDRARMIEAIRCIDRVVLSIDQTRTVRMTLNAIADKYAADTLIFANGGDRHSGEIPEADVCRARGIEMIDGLGDKVRSSSKIAGRA